MGCLGQFNTFVKNRYSLTKGEIYQLAFGKEENHVFNVNRLDEFEKFKLVLKATRIITPLLEELPAIFLLTEADLPFRATKDIDIILIMEDNFQKMAGAFIVQRI